MTKLDSFMYFLLSLFQIQGNFIEINYKYSLRANFQYVPNTIINQTRLNINADLNYFQSKSDFHQSFIKVDNTIFDSFNNDSIHQDIEQFEKSLLETFLQLSNLLKNVSQDVISSYDYYNDTNRYRKIRTNRISDNEFKGNSIFTAFIFNRILPSTTITCETIINLNEQQIEYSNCNSTIAGIININRQIELISRTNRNQSFSFQNNNQKTIRNRIRPIDEFNFLLEDICRNNDWNLQYDLIYMMNNELDDDSLNKILFGNETQYTNCQLMVINRTITDVNRYSATEYVFKYFHKDETIIEHHLSLIENKSTDSVRRFFRNFFNSSCQVSNLIQIRMLMIISDDNLTMECGLNRNNHYKYRLMAFRILENQIYFQNHFRTLLNDENELPEIRIIAFQALHSSLDKSEIIDLMDKIQSTEVRSYLNSLFKRSSIWLAQSGFYKFPFGNIHILFHENLPTLIPSMIQFEIENSTQIDIYFIKFNEEKANSHILLMSNKKSISHFPTLNDLFKWINNDRLFQMKTLDGFYLKINLKINFNLKWFVGYFNNLENFFKRSTAGLILRVQHGLTHVATGYEIRFKFESNFKINIEKTDYFMSYIWRANQRENIFLRIEQTINPLLISKQNLMKNQSSATLKDFCYVIPHFDSKVCLSFKFERAWPSSTSIRLLSDDPSLIYNFTLSNNSMYFHIQQSEQQIIRSYRFVQIYNSFLPFPCHMEFLTPANNYTIVFNWKKKNLILFNLLKNNESLSNGTGLYDYDNLKGLSLNITDINPKHIGNIIVNYNKNLTINAPKLLGGKFEIKYHKLSSLGHGCIEIKAERIFFFFQNNFLVNLYYNIYQSSFNFTLLRNENSKFQLMFIRNDSHLNHLLSINTTLLEFDQSIKVRYGNWSDIGFQTFSLINGWPLWNISAAVINSREIQIQLNRLSFNSEIQHRTFQLSASYLNQRLLAGNFHINQSNFIIVSFDMPKYHLQCEGKINANYTDLSLNLPIIETIYEKTKRQSLFYFNLTSSDYNTILYMNSSIRNQYSFELLQNLTFQYYYLYQSKIQSSLIILRAVQYKLFSYHSFTQYINQSTTVQSWNGSLNLPAIFFSQPCLFNYQKGSVFFIQFFQWGNITQIQNNYHIETAHGLKITAINDLSTRIYFRLEQNLLGQRFLLLFEIDRNWMTTLIINKKIRYELISSPIESLFLLKRIDLSTNKTRLLPISYYTDNQTLIRLEIVFSKFFSAFINDFILDISFKNHTLKLLLHIPLFKREFFSLTWNRYIQKELFHFHGLIEIKLLRRRRLIDYEYNWNLESFRFWSFHSRITPFSFNHIDINLNVTNDYLWYGKWAVNFNLILGNRRELIQLNHKYHYTAFQSNLLFDLHVINSNYDLDFTYFHSNHSIQGEFIKNKYKHIILGYWNTTDNSLQLNTQHIKSITIIRTTFVRSIIDLSPYQRIGILIERTLNDFKNDSQIFECNPYIMIQSRPRLFIVQYYTLNDGLFKMMLEWSMRSYLSWNYTGNAQTLLPLTKFELDTRTKYILRFHTTTFEYSSIYNKRTRQLIIRREPIVEDADDRFILKARYYSNQTLLIHLQVINNHYKIFAEHDENFLWKLHGYFRRDHFNGSLLISENDWSLSSNLNFNSTFYVRTGRYVQLVPTIDPQIALEILLKDRFHFAFQYSGYQSLIAWKFFHNSSNLNLVFISKSINKTVYNMNFQINQLINQSWILELHSNSYYLYNHNYEFIYNGSIEYLSIQHIIDNKITLFSIDKDILQVKTNNFGFILSNLSSETTKYVNLYHLKSKQNLTMNYYKSGRFIMDNYNIQTPIYDINILYYPTDDPNRFIKFYFEFLPLQMSSFSFVRGRTFSIGYETMQKKLILTGNLAFTIEDIDHRDIVLLNERWKLIYGLNKRDRLFLKWNVNFNLTNKSCHGQMRIHDPNNNMQIPINIDIDAYVKDMIITAIFHLNYLLPDNFKKSFTIELNADQRIFIQQYIAIKLIDDLSNTNMSLILNHVPQRKFFLSLKTNNSTNDKSLIYLHANTTESQLKLIFILMNYIHFNLTFPRSYPENGLLHSSLFINDEEYFDARLDTNVFRMRTKDYLLNISLTHLIVQQKFNKQVLASIFTRSIKRNSTTTLISIFSETDFKQKPIPIWQSSMQKTWLERFKQFLFSNNLTLEFLNNLQHFFHSVKNNFLNEHEAFAMNIINHLKFDDDLQLGIQQINSTASFINENLFRIAYFIENLTQQYMNNLTCLKDHQNILHLDMQQLTTLTIDTFIYELVYYVNKTLTMFDYFTHYPRSMSAVLSYICNEIIVNIYKFISNFYLETKKFFLLKIIQYSYDIDFVFNNSSILFDSLSYFSSYDVRTIVYFINNRLRQLVNLWTNSPLEYKIMKTITSQLIDIIDKFRFYIDDRLDFLLPILQVYTSRYSTNHTNNQTFLLTWTKDFNLTSIIDDE